MKTKLFLALALFALLGSALAITPKVLSKFELKKPGFVSYIPDDFSTKAQAGLIVTEFSSVPFSTDYATFIPDTPSQIQQGGIKNFVALNVDYPWPNEASLFPPTVQFPYGGIIVPSGFLVPSKGKGGLYLYKFLDSTRTQVSTDYIPLDLSATWFYHRAVFAHMQSKEESGEFDIVTCRAEKPIVGAAKQQLVIFSYNRDKSTYEENVLLEAGCDVFFRVEDIDKDGVNEIIAADYFNKKLNLIYTEDEKGNWLNKAAVKLHTIDDTIGYLFDLEVVDLNLDGKFEVIATNHQGAKDKIKGSLYIYQVPATRQEQLVKQWDRKAIYEGFPVVKSFIPGSSPGSAHVFYAEPDKKNSTKPFIVVAGDGADQVYLFAPATGPSLDYKLAWNQTLNATVGGIAVGDVDGDGFNEFIAPAYEAGVVYIYSLAAKDVETYYKEQGFAALPKRRENQAAIRRIPNDQE